MDDPVEYGCVDHNTDVVLGVYCLVGHVHNLGLELHHLNFLCAGVDIVQSGVEELLKLAEVFEQTDS